MKVLVTTRRTNGLVEGDYDWTVPGELAWITMVCDTDLRDPEGGCGCGRGFGGMTSHRATTTVEFVDLPMTWEELEVAARTSLTDQGWINERQPEQLNREILDETVSNIRELADMFEVGDVLRRRLDHFVPARRPT
ncbi:DUF7715 family protein [Nocardioides marmoribigeumensis]|uniref:DUF7715 domain-containing protein n=1 Tax=Nocardioides marmoribigeumensis TaxID=433649 RepID=A0ABU2BZP6_9ACTN|nr:hypothetical protein [Nocardioides marmoribigeumensis]MDR7363885.1 hypothetical protein [Nocardioides marmoribigeumensis]